MSSQSICGTSAAIASPKLRPGPTPPWRTIAQNIRGDTIAIASTLRFFRLTGSGSEATRLRMAGSRTGGMPFTSSRFTTPRVPTLYDASTRPVPSHNSRNTTFPASAALTFSSASDSAPSAFRASRKLPRSDLCTLLTVPSPPPTAVIRSDARDASALSIALRALPSVGPSVSRSTASSVPSPSRLPKPGIRATRRRLGLGATLGDVRAAPPRLSWLTEVPAAAPLVRWGAGVEGNEPDACPAERAGDFALELGLIGLGVDDGKGPVASVPPPGATNSSPVGAYGLVLAGRRST
mmetsp:Transcript_28423/g.50780  ORF Transcript_28423/g.50780 Transcript_28423/m.50780 type:complete len:294 (-) Transcript_28423:9-890(-)